MWQRRIAAPMQQRLKSSTLSAKPDHLTVQYRPQLTLTHTDSHFRQHRFQRTLRDLSPRIAESLRRSAAAEDLGGDKGAKALHNDAIAWQLYNVFGTIPTCVAHTKDYLRFYQGHAVLADAILRDLLTAERAALPDHWYDAPF